MKNRYTISGGTAHLLMPDESVVLLDTSDLAVIEGLNWRALYPARSNTGYAVSGRWVPALKGSRAVYMHRLILAAQAGEEVDHMNGNGFDNRRANLRIGTRSQNEANKSLGSRNSSGYKGVVRASRQGAWVAKIECEGEQIHLGTFDSPVDAALAYDYKAYELFGEYARLNFPTMLVERSL